jgi:hypothetical protein
MNSIEAIARPARQARHSDIRILSLPAAWDGGRMGADYPEALAHGRLRADFVAIEAS